MSYILDALKRADAERERGAAPGLHTRHQVPAGSPGAPGAMRNLGLALAAGVVLVMLALYIWVLPAPDPAPAAALAPAAVTAPDAPAPAPAPAPVVAAVPPAAISAAASAPAVSADAAEVRVLPPPAAKAFTAPSSRPGRPDKAASSVPVPAPVTQAAAPAAVPLLAELPQELRSQIPKITITGSVYSNSPAQRLLLINNLVLSQGGQVAPDLTVEEIQPRSSVFSFKGTRFRVTH